MPGAAHFIRPGRTVENGYTESFSGRLRDECLNVQVFFTLADVRERSRAVVRRLQPGAAAQRTGRWQPASLRRELELESELSRRAHHCAGQRCAGARGALRLGFESKTRTAFRPALSGGEGRAEGW